MSNKISDMFDLTKIYNNDMPKKLTIDHIYFAQKIIL